MELLKTGYQYDLLASSTSSGDVSVLHVKLTDAALKAIEEYYEWTRKLKVISLLHFTQTQEARLHLVFFTEKILLALLRNCWMFLASESFILRCNYYCRSVLFSVLRGGKKRMIICYFLSNPGHAIFSCNDRNQKRKGSVVDRAHAS